MYRYFKQVVLIICVLLMGQLILSCQNSNSGKKDLADSTSKESTVDSTKNAKSPNNSFYRHVYNHSSTCSWKLTVTTGNGNVWWNNPDPAPAKWNPDSTWENGSYTIPPNSSIQIKYTQTNGYSSGTWSIEDSDKKTKSFSFDNNDQLYQCPYINHDGSTGGASVNDPANGDITIGQCSW